LRNCEERPVQLLKVKTVAGAAPRPFVHPGVAAVVAMVLIALPASAAVPSYVAAALVDPHRASDARADARRQAAEVVAFSEVKPGDVVIDLVPGVGYFTRIFSRIVGPKGHVYAIWPREYARIDGDEVSALAAVAADPAYANVTIVMEPAAALTAPAKADLVWTSQNYHDFPDRFMGSVDMKQLDRQVLGMLKPGGRFVVIDHAAESGSGLRDTERTHRIDPLLVKDQVTSAGFRLDGESGVLHNPADSHAKLVFDPSIRGHTDQFVFRFRAPQ
jgi:predicted methyltransferase